MNYIIKEAIKQKRVLKFNYDGKSRITEPHTYGKTTAGNEAVRAYETSGGDPGWALFLIEKIDKLSMSGSLFSKKRVGYKQKDKEMSEIFCEI